MEEDLMYEMDDVEAIRAQQLAQDEQLSPEGLAVITRSEKIFQITS